MLARFGLVMLAVCAVASGSSALPASAAGAVAPLVSSGELVENAKEWDGKRVVFEGEAIGDVMVRGAVGWLHVNDDAYAELPIPAGGTPQGYNSGHAVLAPASEAAKVTMFGSYRARGDIVRVTGTFRAADPEHGGDMLIEADRIDVLEPGFAIVREVPRWKLLLLAVLAVVAGAVGVAYRFRTSALPR
jgi:hypothetical protein